MPNLLCIDGIPVSSDEKTKAELYFMEQQVRGKPPASSIACVLHWSFSCVLIMSCYRMWIFPLSCCKDRSCFKTDHVHHHRSFKIDHVLKPLPDLFSLEWNAKHDVSFGTQSSRNRDNTFPGSASGNLIWKKNNPKTDEFCKTDFLCKRIHYANWQSDSVWGVTQESIGFGLLRSAIDWEIFLATLFNQGNKGPKVSFPRSTGCLFIFTLPSSWFLFCLFCYLFWLDLVITSDLVLRNAIEKRLGEIFSRVSMEYPDSVGFA